MSSTRQKIMRHDRKGFVLVLSLLTTIILLALVMPYVSRVVTDYSLTSKIYSSTVALDLAEAGIERAIWEIRYNDEIFNFTIPVSSFQSSAGDSMGEYETTGTTLPDSNSATITSYGYVPSKSSCKAKKTVMVTYSFHRAFGKAVAALNSITMSGQASTDSYDSNIGVYNALVDGVRNIGQEGNIASNGAITLGSNTNINGDANPGPDYPFSGTPPVSGSYGTLQAPLSVDFIVLPPNISSVNDNSRIDIPGDPPIEIFTPGTKDLVLSGTTQIGLPAGTYYFTSITMSGQSSINVTGAATVYIDGASGGQVDVNITGQGIMNSGKPTDLIIYYTGSTIKLVGQASFSGAIYAPSATVTMSGQADVYGSIVCGSNVDSGQAAIHYDKALTKVMPPFVIDKVTSWQEIQQ